MYRKRSGTSGRELFLLVVFVGLTVAGLAVFVMVNTGGLGSDGEPIIEAIPSPLPTDPTVMDESEETAGKAQIQIPAAGINSPIIEVYLDGVSWDVTELGTSVGHLEGTAWLSPQPGNIVLSGHVELRDGRKGVFARIGELGAGDIIILRNDNETRRYSVYDIRNVEPTDLTPVYPTTDDRLTLITCDNFDFFQNSYQERTIVVAQRIS
jgi:LPXTG-site transpeptidase (sortase) family protein